MPGAELPGGKRMMPASATIPKSSAIPHANAAINTKLNPLSDQTKNRRKRGRVNMNAPRSSAMSWPIPSPPRDHAYEEQQNAGDTQSACQHPLRARVRACHKVRRSMPQGRTSRTQWARQRSQRSAAHHASFSRGTWLLLLAFEFLGFCIQALKKNLRQVHR